MRSRCSGGCGSGWSAWPEARAQKERRPGGGTSPLPWGDPRLRHKPELAWGRGAVTSRRAGSAGLPAPAPRGCLASSEDRPAAAAPACPVLARAAARAPVPVGAPRCPATPEPPRRVHAAAIPPSAMARPLQDRSLAEPTAAVSGNPTFPVGGTVALPPSVCRPPLSLPPGLNCMYRCGRALEPPGSLRVNMLPTAPCTQEAAPMGPERRAGGPNGHLPRTPFNLEQAIGARLRHMGDRFQQDHEQREQRPRGALWAHLYHFVFHLLGILGNLPARG